MENTNRAANATGRIVITADSIAAVGGGMFLAQMALSLPDTFSEKGLLIDLVPAVTLILKQSWNFLELEVVFALRNGKANYARNRYLKFLDSLLADSRIDEETKEDLKQVIVYSQLSAFFVLYKHWKENYQQK
ncbi:hypothetical protein [Chitinophaga caseinilytica]|uniref:CRISPR type III-B/RAMP module-associated protein Cmr5 n=1 Tax=Chitinophaga caseinilytica TaxID=2267521 RepID=A0ABZ2Z4X0_9BACT